MTTHQQKIITLRVVALILAVLVFLAWATDDVHADTGFLVDQYTKGSKRYCIYDTPSGEVIITVDYADLCPLTVEV